MSTHPPLIDNKQSGENPELPHLETIGVIGAGVMGVGLAHALAQSGLRTLLIDISDSILESALRQIRNNIRFQTLFHKNPASAPEEILARIKLSADYDVLRDADFVVENVTEKLKVKTDVYRRLDQICPPQCIFAANTSAIPITRIGAITRRPTRVLGMHFMNPVPLKTAVEVIRGYHTSDETIATATRLLNRMGKRPIVVADSPGFVSNRVLMLTINEAIFLVQEKIASPEVVDDIFKNCFEHKMGPLETADLIGLDTILFSIEVLYDEFKDSKFRPCPLLRQMVDAGLHGRKSGRGFYNYND
ncbi:MAG TPA: 3-hydroxyacyl-CoA dehydrogenase NAD-binding domain-containing protein [Candidatus Angelobacter sp.]|jgi:3-hydroxybutyryl-CoA dehydrogenase|nr:3-hydroxyacyl-CoA dehydrogenase NAD-binding domain-containing protein [Candidatus Angelobacter sp.]